MKINLMRGLALTLGFSVATVAQAQYNGYPAAPGYAPQQPASSVPLHPSLYPNTSAQQQAAQRVVAQHSAPQQPVTQRASAPQSVPPAPRTAYRPTQPAASPMAASAWGNYRRPASTPFQTASTGSGVATGQPAPLPAPQGGPAAHGGAAYGSSIAEQPCNSCNDPQVGHIYNHAAASSWSGGLEYGGAASCGPVPVMAQAPLRNWFGGANLLFLDLEENCDRRLLFDTAMPLTTALSSSQVDPGSNVAFETYFGRYFNCGQHALLVNYFFFDPTSETARVDAGTGANGRNMNVAIDYRAAMPSWNNIMYDVGNDGMPGNDVPIYGLFDGNVRYRTSRDVSFQGIELNLVSFGLGGARRAASSPLACGDTCGPVPGCGGACGPMIPPTSSKLQIQTTHGLRWFQFKDSFEFATSQTDTVYGATADDLYYNVDTENNLFGYQFGARLDYCLGHKLNLYAGTKMGIYANDARYRTRLGSMQSTGYVSNYYPTIQGRAVAIDNSETVLATLGELDLGLGYRINNCWSVRGGYRLYGISGVATSVGSIADDLANLPEAGKVCADDSLLLHGGYIGAEYNW